MVLRATDEGQDQIVGNEEHSPEILDGTRLADELRELPDRVLVRGQKDLPGGRFAVDETVQLDTADLRVVEMECNPLREYHAEALDVAERPVPLLSTFVPESCDLGDFEATKRSDDCGIQPLFVSEVLRDGRQADRGIAGDLSRRRTRVSLLRKELGRRPEDPIARR